MLNDPVLGIAFLAPGAYSYLPATTGNLVPPYLTTAARLSSYASSPPGPLMQELLIQMQLISTDQDLRTIARTRFQCDLGTLRDMTVAARQAVRWEGQCAEDAARIRVLIAVGPGRVLVVNALPPDSTRLADFERVLASLAWMS